MLYDILGAVKQPVRLLALGTLSIAYTFIVRLTFPLRHRWRNITPCGSHLAYCSWYCPWYGTLADKVPRHPTYPAIPQLLHQR